jgi:hypothetical protein
MQYGSGAGAVGPRGYLELWSVAELLQRNRELQPAWSSHRPIFVGTDGGGELLAYEPETGLFVQHQMIGMTPETAQVMGASFLEFLRSLAEGGLPDT